MEHKGRLTKLIGQHGEALVVATFMGVLLWASHIQTTEARSALAQERACEKSPACMDMRAANSSAINDIPTQSRTGRWFFGGKSCDGDCRAMQSGYRWAERTGITKELGCNDPNTEFTTGCLLFVEAESTPYRDAGIEPM